MQRIAVPACALVLAAVTTALPAAAAAQGDPAAQLPSTTRPMNATPGTPGDAPLTTPGASTRPRDAAAVDATAKSLHDWERGHRGSKIIGTDVRNLRKEKIGEVRDIVLDDQGTVAYAVVATGRFLGVRDRLHAVPWRALQTNASGRDYFVLDIDKARLAAAPGFDSRSWPEFADERWSAENRKHFELK